MKKKVAIVKIDGVDIALRMGLATGLLKGFVTFVLDVDDSNDATIADAFLCYLETVGYDGELIADSFESLCEMRDLTPSNLSRLQNALIETQQDEDIINLVAKILELQNEL